MPKMRIIALHHGAASSIHRDQTNIIALHKLPNPNHPDEKPDFYVLAGEHKGMKIGMLVPRKAAKKHIKFDKDVATGAWTTAKFK